LDNPTNGVAGGSINDIYDGCILLTCADYLQVPIIVSLFDPDIDERFQQTFGASLLHSEEVVTMTPGVVKLWLRITVMKNCHYDLPSGVVGKEFADLLSSEICLLTKGLPCSKRILVYVSFYNVATKLNGLQFGLHLGPCSLSGVILNGPS